MLLLQKIVIVTEKIGDKIHDELIESVWLLTS